MCEPRRVYTEKKTRKCVVKQGDSGKLMAPRRRLRKTHTHTHTHMKPTVATALELARNALYSQQLAILRDIRDLQGSVDSAYVSSVEVDTYVVDQIVERKAKLAEIIVARESLYHIEISGI